MTTQREGVVLQGTGGVWQVRTDDGETRDASLRGRLKQEGTPRENRETRDSAKDGGRALKLAVGDRVTVSGAEDGNAWTIDAIQPRRSKLARKRPGNAKGERIIVANLDQVIVVFAAANPEPHPRMLDRFLVIAEANDLAARIVINKVDLASESDVRTRFAEFTAAGYPLHLTSVKADRGLDDLRDEIAGRGSALTGPSGVGKSSLMNTLFPGLNLRTAEISDSVNKGRHTTVGALLHALPGGGFIADTPGLREVGLWGLDTNEIPACFPEFRPLLDRCRFADCTHTVEPGCAIRDAVSAGSLSRGRYDSYVKLREELAVASADVW
ncbi:MAG: ribosome small subunit-dependent GTPase A [Gemmatimonas sp.]